MPGVVDFFDLYTIALLIKIENVKKQKQRKKSEFHS